MRERSAYVPPVRVLVVAEDEQLSGPLADGLARLGWPCVCARDEEAALVAAEDLAPEAVLVAPEGAAALADLPRRLRAACAPRRTPVVALAEPQAALDQLGFDLAVAPPAHPAQIAARLESLVRTAVGEEEAELRARTYAAMGASPSVPGADATPLAVLTVGEPAPKFLALSHALGAGGAEVTGAFTAYTAFDYLHERAFDAVVLWTGDTHAEALSIAAGMKRNTRLYHIPTVLYGRQGVQVALKEAFDRGLSEVADASTVPATAAARILSLARAHRRERQARDALERGRGLGLLEASTGLFTRDLFALHLGRLAQAMPARRRSLSVAVLRVELRPAAMHARRSGALERAMPQIGSMLGRLVRVEDTAARLAPDVFALALPGSRRAAAQAAAERIAAVIGCTAFDLGGDEPPFTVEFAVGAAEVGHGDTAGGALERAAARSSALAAG